MGFRPDDWKTTPGLKETTIRYERDCPGDLVHMDVRKFGRIPDGVGGEHTTGRCTSDLKSLNGTSRMRR